MATKNKPLELSETYMHYNSLIWQVPSWGIAIAAAVIVAADQIGKETNTWMIPLNYVQASILAFGAFLLIGLTIALYRYRAFQAASVPELLQSPPFRQKPSANCYLQGGLSLTTGGIAGLAGVQALSETWLIVIGLIIGIIGWIFAEYGNKAVVNKINDSRK